MTYAEAIQFLYDLQLFGTKLGLENTFRLAALAVTPSASAARVKLRWWATDIKTRRLPNGSLRIRRADLDRWLSAHEDAA